MENIIRPFHQHIQPQVRSSPCNDSSKNWFYQITKYLIVDLALLCILVPTPSILGGRGKSAKRTVACFEALFLVLDRIFPIVIYIGQAFLSPEKLVKKVTSEVHMIGDRVAPSGNLSFAGCQFACQYLV